jgi:hypothetical protein
MIRLALLGAIRQALRLGRWAGLRRLEELVVRMAGEAAVAEPAVAEDIRLGVVEHRRETDRGRGRVEHGPS